jgi:hypothetical protein
LKNRSSVSLLITSLKALLVFGLCASTWQLAQATPENTPNVVQNNAHNITVKTIPKNVPYKALSAHDAAWYKAHPHYKPSPKRGWIKTLPHRYRVVKQNHQTYYYSHGRYYQRSTFGYVAVKVPFSLR